MSNYSDNKKPAYRIAELLPEVYLNPTSATFYASTVDRALTKDDTVQVYGNISVDPASTTIPQPTTLKQAFPLMPTMVTPQGVETQVLSYQSFMSQLALMGVDPNRVDKWAIAEQFNWAPPVNLDMLVNYSEYFWLPSVEYPTPQYVTIENPCEKSRNKVYSFEEVVGEYGSEFVVTGFAPESNALRIAGDVTFIFTSGLSFTTRSSTPAFDDATFSVASSMFDVDAYATIIELDAPYATVSDTPPTSPQSGDLWFNTLTKRLMQRTGSSWVTFNGSVTLDLAPTLFNLKLQSNCACSGDYGWDVEPFDLSDEGVLWDSNAACDVPTATEWATQNRWVHQTDSRITPSAIRATIPIIEYSADVEMMEWAQRTPIWKYRSGAAVSFNAVDTAPSKLELAPIKDYRAVQESGVWVIYTYNQGNTLVGVDYTDVFTPGSTFNIRTNAGTTTYTVAASQFKQIEGGVFATPPTETTYATRIELDAAVFTSPLTGMGVQNARIEPRLTSRGDLWVGYSTHWVLTALTAQQPAPAPTLHYDYRRAHDFETLISKPNGMKPTSATALKLSPVSQSLTVATSGETTVDIHPQFAPGTGYRYAVKGSNGLRVYVNGVRQYGNYIEVSEPTTVDAYIGTTISTQQVELVTAIELSRPLSRGDNIRIEVGSPAAVDFGRENVLVRTNEDDASYVPLTASGIVTTFKYEQVKRGSNTYPQFATYDVVDNTIYSASAIFTYAESPDSPISPEVNARIVRDIATRNVTFEQHLITDDNQLLAYRVGERTYDWWFDGELVRKNLSGVWYQTFPVTVDSLEEFREVIVSQDDPVEVHGVEMAFWYNPSSGVLRAWVGSEWEVVEQSISVSASDPQLRIIWAASATPTLTDPQYVDGTGAPTPLTNPLGVWQVVDQWWKNPSHQNRRTVQLSDVVSHFRDIISHQPIVPGLLSSGRFALLQSDYDLGLGGTIKEHDDSFDFLMSAVNAETSTPVSVLEFASKQQAVQLTHIRETFTRNISQLITSATIPDSIPQIIIDLFEQNDWFEQVYHDTSAYNAATGVGIRNWAASGPILKLSQLHVPYYNSLQQEVVAHDGSRISTRLNATELAIIKTQIGKPTPTSNTAPTVPATYIDLTDMFTTPMVGVVVYVKADRQIYVFNPAYIVDTAPTGATLPSGPVGNSGELLLNTYDGGVYVWNSLTSEWEFNSFDITPLWVLLDIEAVYASVVLEVQTRLYNVAVADDSPSYSWIEAINGESDLAERLLEQRFQQYVIDQGLVAPYTNANYKTNDPYTWNYSSSSVDATPTLDIPPPAVAQAFWKDVYQHWYGTPYPNEEPWKLQLYANKPHWWDQEYASSVPNRLWTDRMWYNIKERVIPGGRDNYEGVVGSLVDYVDASLPQYQFVSVDVRTDVLLPPYSTAPSEVVQVARDDTIGSPVTTWEVRTLYGNVVQPGADFTYASGSPLTWEWRWSPTYVGDQLIVAFQLQPSRTLQKIYGHTLTYVNRVPVDVRTKRVPSYKDSTFHGQLAADGNVIEYRGLNQWYVNYHRYNNVDMGLEFSQEWVNWDPLLTYQTSNIVDPSSVFVAAAGSDISADDVRTILTNTGVVADVWVDTLVGKLTSIPPAIIQYNNQSDWNIELSSPSRIARTVEYYGVKSYPFVVSPIQQTVVVDGETTDIITYELRVFAWTVSSAGANQLRTRGDATPWVASGDQIVVQYADGVGTVYEDALTVVDATYNSSSRTTTITIIQTATSDMIDGILFTNKKMSGWSTNDQIVLNTTRTLPNGLDTDTVYILHQVDGNVYYLCDTPADAIQGFGVNVGFGTLGSGQHMISQVESSFFVYGGQGTTGDRWYHYAIDYDNLLKTPLPQSISGMQTLVNVVDGLRVRQQEVGVGMSPEYSDVDPDTGREVTWNTEVERFINWAYGLQRARTSFNDRYQISIVDNALTFIGQRPQWAVGTAVRVTSSGGVLPHPLSTDQAYYIYVNAQGNTQLAISPVVTNSGQIISIDDGSCLLSIFDRKRDAPSQEINPYRNRMTIRTPEGMLADVVAGPYRDIRTTQSIFDQYGRRLSPQDIFVDRFDEVTTVKMVDRVFNDVDPTFGDDPYSFLHIGGSHIFINAYEHFVIFNQTLQSGETAYDQFYGYIIPNVTMGFRASVTYTKRPSLGGFMLNGGQYQRNIEGTIGDMTRIYDAYLPPADPGVADAARSIVGYTPDQAYMTSLDATPVTQFKFFQGMVQTKGSINSLIPYISSSAFVSADVDEYWAYKVSEYGDARPKQYPEIMLRPDDVATGDVRLHFLTTTETRDTNSLRLISNEGFAPVSFADEARWRRLPEQRTLITSPLFMDAAVQYLAIAIVDTIPDHVADYWYDTTTNTMHQWVDTTWVPTNDIIVIPSVGSGGVYIGINTRKFDDYRLVRQVPQADDLSDYTTQLLSESNFASLHRRVNASTIYLDDTLFSGVLIVGLVVPDRTVTSPARLVDFVAGSTIASLPIWHPAYTLHDQISANKIHMFSDDDPALYNNAVDISRRNEFSCWTVPQESTVWLDTQTLHYMPYYDAAVYPAVDDRIRLWGALAPYSTPQLYVWVSSPVPPQQWDTFVQTQAADDAVAPSEKATGTPKQNLYRRTRTATQLSATAGSSSFQVAGQLLELYDTVQVVGGDEVGFDPSAVYTVVDVTGTVVKLQVGEDTTEVVATASGVAEAIRQFTETDWEYLPPYVTHSRALEQTTLVYNPISNLLEGTQLVFSNDGFWSSTDTASVYVNGALIGSLFVVVVTPTVITISGDFQLNEYDIIAMVRNTPSAVLHPGDDTTATNDVLVQYKLDTPYSIAEAINDLDPTSPATRYFFWVSGTTTSYRGTLPTAPILAQFTSPTTPYMVVEAPTDDPRLVEKYGYGTINYGSVWSLGTLSELQLRIPVVYRRTILRGVAPYVTGFNRVGVRYTRDWTFREELYRGNAQPILKNTYQEWKMIRKNQPAKIDRVLWDKLVDTACGFQIRTVNGALTEVPIPSTERLAYDLVYGTSTSYGIGVDQSMTRAEYALNTITSYLSRSDVDFTPVNVSTFLQAYPLDTPQQVRTSLTQLYDTFTANHVNAIWFAVLDDMCAVTTDMTDVFKTSWVSVEVVQPLVERG